jgi:hypothetical protein
MGWGDYLRMREEPLGWTRKRTRQALAIESSNVFAHAMWGHHHGQARGHRRRKAAIRRRAQQRT